MNPPRFAKNKVEAAKELGVTPKTLDRWRKLPGAPKPRADYRVDLVQWRAFVKANNLKGGETSEIEKLKARRLLDQCIRIEHDNDVAAGKYIAFDDLLPQLTMAAGRIKEILIRKFENELPVLLVGLDVAGIRAQNSKAIDAALRDLKVLLKDLEDGSKNISSAG